MKLVGIDHVGIGSDSDLNGYDDMPADQRKELMGITSRATPSATSSTPTASTIRRKTFDLTEALIRRGYSDATIEAVLGGNFRRLLGSIWA